jgi:3-hydroxybutyryl-CoA dehydratase
MTVAGDYKAGDTLAGFARLVTQERIEAYANASGDFNPIHIDAEFAKNTQFGQRIAHGMLVLAFVSEMLAANFPATWHRGGRLKVRFRNPVFPGETVSVFGEVAGVSGSGPDTVLELKIGCRKPDGSEAISGEASVPVG